MAFGTKWGVGTPGLALVTFFKRVASLGKGTDSDPLASKTVEEKLQTLARISVGRTGDSGDAGCTHSGAGARTDSELQVQRASWKGAVPVNC